MNPIVILGGGGHAKVLIHVLKNIVSYEIIGYLDPQDRGPLLGVSCLGNDAGLTAIKKRYPQCAAALGIGNVKISDERRKWISLLHEHGFKLPAIVSPFARVAEDVKIGAGTVVFDGAVIQSGVQIGEASILNTGALIDHDVRIGDFVHIAPGVTVCGGVEIGNDSLIGAGATILQYKKITAQCLIGAGAVVTRHCEHPGTYWGIPAKKQQPSQVLSKTANG